MPKNPPGEVAAIRAAIKKFFDTVDPETDRQIGSAKCGVYAFYDYDGEPIYVGQTVEGVRGRVGRHLTGRRSDSVGKFVLDPFEVLRIEVWPMFYVEDYTDADKKREVNAAEFAVFEKVVAESAFNAVLNEGGIADPGHPITLPKSWQDQIIPADLYEDRKHPDVRIARRAQTIANLARLISERAVGDGIRTTLLVQAQRLELLARQRLEAQED